MNFFGFLLTALTSFLQNFLNADTPAGRLVMYGNNYITPNAIPDIMSLGEFRRRELISEDNYKTKMQLYGFTGDWADNMYNITHKYLDLRDYITLHRRGKIDKGQLIKRGEYLGFREHEVDNALAVTEYFPSPADLIRFAVREVYTPAVAQKFGLFEDIPSQFISESSKAGLPVDQARNFWASHWELPSPLQGFAMLHRRIIDRPTMELLLKSLDVMPFWRDKMIDLSYNPLTRVDVRRMYGLGVLNESGVRNAYLDVGYSPENAQLMTEFTTRYENSEADGLTRSNIIKAYVESLINRDDLVKYLDLLGYDDKVVQFWIDYADYEKTEREIKLITEDAVELYVKGDITIDQIRDKLLEQDLPAIYVDRILKETVLQQAKRRKVPSKADLETWLRSQIIEEEYYTEKMRLIGYTDTDIQYYLSDIALTTDTEKQKYLSISTYARWLKKGIITEDTFRTVAAELNYSEKDIDRLVAESLPPVVTPEGGP